MKTPFHTLIRFFLCLLVTSHLVSCATSSALSSRTRHVGTVTAIKECRADAQRAYVLWQVEKDSAVETSVVELKTRNASLGGRLPVSARMVPIVELSGETAGLPKGHTLPCLGIWRARSDRPDGPFAPRVRWINRDRDFCVNLPAKVAEPGKNAARVPLAVVKDVFMLGILTVTLPATAVAPLFQGDVIDLDAREVFETWPTAVENTLENLYTTTSRSSDE